jgi:hypothetical protein
MKSFRAVSRVAAIALVAACGAASADAPAKADRQRELNYEYAKLYKAASGLRLLDELLLVKLESKETEQVVKQIAAFGTRTKAELEDLARAHPEISLDEDGRTALSRESSKRQQRDRLRAFAPVTGATGADFERLLLLGQWSALYQLRFRVEVMAEAETSEARRAYLRKMHKELDGLYVQTARLLDQRHFRPPAKTPLGGAGGDD